MKIFDQANRPNQVGCAKVSMGNLTIHQTTNYLTLYSFSPQVVVDFQFHPETDNKINPKNPACPVALGDGTGVNPVEKELKCI